VGVEPHFCVLEEKFVRSQPKAILQPQDVIRGERQVQRCAAPCETLHAFMAAKGKGAIGQRLEETV
jgi:hypothetical protein